MRKICYTASVVALTVGLTLVEAQASRADDQKLPPQKWALLVGVDDYTHFRDLEYCQADVEGLRKSLVDVGFPKDNVTLLTDGAEQQHHLPFKNNIERQLQLLLATVREQDMVVVAYSGHGLYLSGTSYLCPTDSLLSEPTKTMVSLDSVYQMLQSCPARQKLLLVDACRNDPSLTGAKSAATFNNSQEFMASLKQPPEGILLLTSCKEGQRSVEDPKFGHGVFLYYLIEGLEGAADANRNGMISLFELYMYSELKTKTYVRNTCNLIQTPVMKGEIAGVYDIGTVPDRTTHSNEAESLSRPASQPDLSATAATQTPTALPSPSHPDSENMGIKAAIAQADEYFVQGKFSEAVDAYSSVLLIDSTNRNLNLKRGSVYLAKGDIEKAVIDYQLGGKPLPLPVTTASAKLKFGDTVTATVRRGQTLAITKISNLNGYEWLFVASVDGNDAARGWIHKDAVIATLAEKTASETTSALNTPQHTTSQHYSGDANSRRYAPQSSRQRRIEQGRQRNQSNRRRPTSKRFGGRSRRR